MTSSNAPEHKTSAEDQRFSSKIPSLATQLPNGQLRCWDLPWRIEVKNGSFGDALFNFQSSKPSSLNSRNLASESRIPTGRVRLFPPAIKLDRLEPGDLEFIKLSFIRRKLDSRKNNDYIKS
jgi:hypothetical protein